MRRPVPLPSVGVVESRPTRFTRFVFIAGETTQAHRPKLLGEEARRVEDQEKETADRRGNDPGQM